MTCGSGAFLGQISDFPPNTRGPQSDLSQLVGMDCRRFAVDAFVSAHREKQNCGRRVRASVHFVPMFFSCGNMTLKKVTYRNRLFAFGESKKRR